VTTISAEVILASRHLITGKVLWTLKCRYPWIIHSEGQTHRLLEICEDMDVMIKTPSLMADQNLSRNAGSTRAIPVKKMIQSVLDDPFVPLVWLKNQAGMQGTEDCNAPVCISYDSEATREEAWLWGMDQAIRLARAYDDAGYHKQIVNRLLAPYSHITVVVSGTEWSNFFALRDHGDAEPHIHLLAQAIKKAMQEAEENRHIQILHPGQWHVPFISSIDRSNQRTWVLENIPDHIKGTINETHEIYKPWYAQYQVRLLKLSAARCASTSYKTVEGFDMTLDRAIPLFDKLATHIPMHASPLEHVAMADDLWNTESFQLHQVGYKHPKDHRNFQGFRQLRALVENGEFK
jgi:hypothetical protein